MQVKFNVKEKSVYKFLKDRVLEHKPSNNNTFQASVDSPYYLLKDEMYFKIDCGVEVGESVKIELLDRGGMSGKELVNRYTYTAKEYDDLALKMVLSDFKVELKNINNQNK